MRRHATGPGKQIRSENGIVRAMEIVGAMIDEPIGG